MAVLVLGGYGLIGSAIVERLGAQGVAVVGLGRRIDAARKRWPYVEWRAADIAGLTTAEAWRPLLTGVDTVVNAAGALQQGLADDVIAVQQYAMIALYVAAQSAGVRRVVQVSAVGASPDSPLAFFRTKGAADDALRASGLEHVILRPGLVISPTAYGGTALLRGLAAFPFLTPLVFADSVVQTVAVDDVAKAVAAAVDGKLDSGLSLDLVEEPRRTLAETVAVVRAWLGLAPTRTLRLPSSLASVVGVVADGLGWLGWRSPLRSTALAVMRTGVIGDAGAARGHLGRPLPTLPQTLARMSAGPQERWFARMWLLKPLTIAGLSAFWIASGVIALYRATAAIEALTARGAPANLATGLVRSGAIVDIALGLAVLVRPLAAWSLRGMVLAGLAYMAGSVALAPDLWLDPLGPMVKIAPILILALVGLAVLDER